MRRTTILLCLCAAGGWASEGCAEHRAAKAAAAAEPEPPEAPWAEMTSRERHKHMRRVVLPMMKVRFASHDPERFDEVRCETCHGPRPRDRRFEMPSEHLPRLDPTDGFAAHGATEPEMVAFMKNEVVPVMAEALGLPVYDPATQQGFGCFRCHLEK
jgi:hypothetical protein